jgi:PAS domain-containing protein
MEIFTISRKLLSARMGPRAGARMLKLFADNDPGVIDDALMHVAEARLLPGVHALTEAGRELTVFAADTLGVQSYLGQFGDRPVGLSRAERRRLRDDIERSSIPYLVIDPRPGLRIIDMNDARAEATMTTHRGVVGEKLFEVFPDNPDLASADGSINLHASLQQAAQSGHAHAMAVQRYDLLGADGRFVERHWRPLNVPIFDDGGKLLYLLHQVTEVTPGDPGASWEYV